LEEKHQWGFGRASLEHRGATGSTPPWELEWQKSDFRLDKGWRWVERGGVTT